MIGGFTTAGGPTVPGVFRRRRLAIALLAALALLASLGAGRASAAKPWWQLTSRMVPTHLEPGGEATIFVQAINVGNAPTAGNYLFSDVLPNGLSIKEAHFFARPSQAFVEFEIVKDSARPDFGPEGEFGVEEFCKESPNGLSCSSESPLFGPELPEFFLNSIVPFDFIEMRLKVKDEGATPGALNELSVSGGGAAARTTKHRSRSPPNPRASASKSSRSPPKWKAAKSTPTRARTPIN